MSINNSASVSTDEIFKLAALARTKNEAVARVSEDVNKQRGQMLVMIRQFFGVHEEKEAPLFKEGEAVRELLAALGREVVLCQDDGQNSRLEYVWKNSAIRVRSYHDGALKSESSVSVLQFFEMLIKKGVLFEFVLANIRLQIVGIKAELLGTAQSSSGPKQTYPAIGCIVNVSGQKFIFAERMGYGLVSLNGWPHLIAFNCPAGSHECEGHSISLTDQEMRAVEDSQLYHHVLPVYRPRS